MYISRLALKMFFSRWSITTFGLVITPFVYHTIMVNANEAVASVQVLTSSAFLSYVILCGVMAFFISGMYDFTCYAYRDYVHRRAQNLASRSTKKETFFFH